MSVTEQSARTRRLVVMAMLIAIAYALAVATHFLPGISVSFLKYDPKSVIVAIGGFLFGPVAALTMSVSVAVLELVTGISDTGWIGLIMNVLTTAGFACVSAFIYTKRRTVGGAIVGLTVAVAVTTGLMLLWNYLITPLYMHIDRSAVVGMLLPLFLPFNLLQGVANAALTLMLYNPLVTALRAARLLPPSTGAPKNRRITLWLTLVSAFVLFTALLVVLAWNGVI